MEKNIEEAIEALERAKELMFENDIQISKVWQELNVAIQALKQSNGRGVRCATTKTKGN